MSEQSLIECKLCHYSIEEGLINICYCNYHLQCIEFMIRDRIKNNSYSVKIQSFKKSLYSIQCPHCQEALLFTTKFQKKNCSWCHFKSRFRQSRLIFIFTFLASIFALLLAGFGIFVIWNFQDVFSLIEWKKYLVISVLLLLIVIILIQTAYSVYTSLGMWVENKIIIIKKKEEFFNEIEENRLKKARVIDNLEMESIKEKEEERREEVEQIMTLEVESDVKNDEERQKKKTTSVIYSAEFDKYND